MPGPAGWLDLIALVLCYQTGQPVVAMATHPPAGLLAEWNFLFFQSECDLRLACCFRFHVKYRVFLIAGLAAVRNTDARPGFLLSLSRLVVAISK